MGEPGSGEAVTTVTVISRANQFGEDDTMVIAQCLLLPAYHRPRCCPLPSIGRIVIVISVLVVAAVLAVKGYSPDEITGPMLVLVAGAVTAADPLAGTGHGHPARASHAS